MTRIARVPRIYALPSRSFVRRLSTVPTDDEIILSHDAHHQGLSYLSLNRPKAKNALSTTLVSSFRFALDAIVDPSSSASPTRVLIVNSSSPGSFCAGADLKERRDMSPAQVDAFLNALRQAFSALEDLPIPTIAAIDGPALGGGLELALACDLRVAGPGATQIGLTETRIGIIPGAGGTQRLTRLLGLSRAKSLIFAAKVLSAQKAHELGIVDAVAEDGESATDRAVRLAADILPNAPLAVKASKLAINRSLQLDLETGLDFERACYNTLLTSQDRLEGLRAFAEKRKAVFTGQ